MTNCATKGHEKIPAVNILKLADGREAPVCSDCEARRYAEIREGR